MFNYILLAILVLLLSSCGGGGGQSDSNANEVQYKIISGLASKGAINSASITIYASEDTDFSNPLASGITKNDGSYSVTLNKEYSGIVVVKVEGGAYIDEATGITVTLGTNTLSSVAEITEEIDNTVVITPLTDLAYKHLKGATPTEESVLSANDFVAHHFGLQGVSITSVIPDDITSVEATNTANGKYGTILAAFSQITSASITDGGFANVSNLISVFSSDLIIDNGFDEQSIIRKALQDIKTNSNIKHNDEVIESVSSTISSSYIPNITSAGSYIYQNNTAINPIVFNNTGGYAIWDINLSLPDGLEFNKTTGVISGTPTVVSDAVVYTVVATNTSGYDSATVVIQVNPIAPNIANIGDKNYIKDTIINDIIFTNTGGVVSTWSISPQLPSGLVLNATTGVISGMPLTVSNKQLYSIIASNIIGSDTAQVYITVNDKKPNIANIDSRNFIVNKYISSLNFINTGGIASAWSISPSFNNGLVLNAITGVISGTPTIIGSAIVYTVTASNITGFDSAIVVIQINPIAPSIADLDSKTYTQTVPITAINFTNTGGDITSWAINRSLPLGLNFNTNTGEISGTPNVSAQLSEYIITASNISGSNIARVSILVVPSTPNIANISLVEFIKGVEISSISWTNTGGVASAWSISPQLPSGLVLNATTGVISGMPNISNNTSVYIVTASNITGSATASIDILIKLSAPIISNVNDKVFINNVSITSFGFVNTGGIASTWSISPQLPSGLVLNATSGAISGMPNIISSKTAYTVTAINHTGSSSTSFSITVNDSAPIIADIEPKVYANNKAISPVSFVNTGGIASTWSISPSFNNGLVLNATTGVISGIPTVEMVKTTYTIIASNITGSDNARIIITINQGLPDISNLTKQTFVENIAINPINFTNTGGAASTWNISPQLPNNLIFNTLTGAISGIPNTISPAVEYTITAINISGADSAKVVIEILRSSPSIVSIARQDFTQGSTIANINFVNTGGDADLWSINPSLPSGLVFNTSTGEISGTPNISSTLTIYRVIASNISGNGSATIAIAINAIARISGEIIPAVLIGVDSDVNDPNTTIISNNTFSSAQEINNYFAISGFVANSKPPSGAFVNSGDIRDFYKVSLLAGQNINLHISDHAGAYGYTGDLDLWLYDSSYTLVDFSYSVSEFENIIVARNDTYYIEIEAYSGRSKYVLSLQPSSNSSSIGNNNVNFVVNQSIISHKKINNNNSISIQTPSVRLQQTNSLSDKQRIEQANKLSEFESELANYNLDSYDKYNTLHSIKDINVQSATNSAQPNYIYYPLTTTPNDSYYGYQWHYDKIRLPEAWDISTGQASDRDIIVAVIDTGVFLAHADLEGKFVQGYDFIINVANSGDGDGIDNNPDDPGDGNILGNSSWHGTHVAGTIGAKSNNSLGVAGTSWHAKIMPLRALGKGGGTEYDIIQSLLYAAQMPNDSGTIPVNKADVINLSIGGGSYSQATQDIYTSVRNAGIIIISSAGNENNSILSYPASYDGVVSVSAIDYNNNKAPYSSYGSKVDIAAPGGDTSADLNSDSYGDGVLSTLVNTSNGQRTGNYAFYQGTSMAAPHVAGVVALMRAVYPDLTPDQFDDLLFHGMITNEAGDSGRDDIYGYGIIDAYKAVQEANSLAQGGTIPPIPANIQLSSNQLNLGYTTTGEFSITNTGDVSASIISITTITAWISIASKSIDNNKLGTYQININRDNLSPGFYSGNINFTTSIGTTLTLLVTMNVGAGSNASYIGNVIVALFDSSLTYVTRATITDISGGRYSYSFEDVANGEYFVIAGSDIDYDSIICQLGENCGAYPVFNAIEKVVINNNSINAIDFVVEILSSSYNNANNTNNNTGQIILKINK